MRQYLSDSIHAMVDDNYVTVDNNYVTMSMRQKKNCLVIVACDFAAAINHLTTFTEAFRWSFF